MKLMYYVQDTGVWMPLVFHTLMIALGVLSSGSTPYILASFKV